MAALGETLLFIVTGDLEKILLQILDLIGREIGPIWLHETALVSVGGHMVGTNLYRSIVGMEDALADHLAVGSFTLEVAGQSIRLTAAIDDSFVAGIDKDDPFIQLVDFIASESFRERLERLAALDGVGGNGAGVHPHELCGLSLKADQKVLKVFVGEDCRHGKLHSQSDPSLMVEVRKYLADTNKINAKENIDNLFENFLRLDQSAGARICVSLSTGSQSVKGLTKLFPVTRWPQHSLTHSQITI